MKRKKYDTKAYGAFCILGYGLIILLTLACLMPFVMMLSGSFSTEKEILIHGFSLFPQGFTLDAYRTILSVPGKISNAYLVTAAVTLIGTAMGLMLVSLSGYVLSRPDFQYRNAVSFYIYFTTLFSGGTIPWYIVTTQMLHLKNSIWALIIPIIMSPFNIFLFKNFLRSIPNDIMESARMDGAGEFRIFSSMILPLSKPALAAIGLFMALTYWNDWFRASLLVSREELYPLQYLLFRMMSNAKEIANAGDMNTGAIPTETMKLSMAIITTGPVLLFYPFAQKYFVSGLTIGGVKG